MAALEAGNGFRTLTFFAKSFEDLSIRSEGDSDSKPKMMERKGYAAPGPNTKGGGFKGGPKRWTGHGPAPARHIPWPEIFKHHMSLIEGHLKMVDMVRKHTVEGSGNYKTIMECVNRTREMLRDTKHITRDFVPPPNQREQVPLGSSSVSMYPGYSPADHTYGKAAEEYGKAAAEAKAKGIELSRADWEYNIGQSKGMKRQSLAQIRAARSARESGSGSGTGSGSDQAADPSSTRPPATDKETSEEKADQADSNEERPLFVIDTKPTPVDIPGMVSQATKRDVSPSADWTEAHKHKKAKNKHEGELPDANDMNGVQFADISEEVDVRMKEKEAKRKRKEEKKRKRESEGEPAVSATTVPETKSAPTNGEKPKKKKSKHDKNETLADESISKKRSGEPEGASEDGEGKKKKKRRKGQTAAGSNES